MAEDERDSAKQQWVKSLSEARNNCREKIGQAVLHVSDPTRCKWPMLPSAAMSREQRMASQAHMAVLDYHDHLRPAIEHTTHLSDGIDDLWSEELLESPIDGFPAISLSTLPKWEAGVVEETVTANHELYGKQKEKEQQTILLPVIGMRRSYSRMNDLLQRLNLAIDAGGLPRGEIADQSKEVNDVPEPI